MCSSDLVSLVFELLGGTFALSLIKVRNSDTLGLGDLINTDKALSVIMAIFVSVAIAFFFGMLVQWLSAFLESYRPPLDGERYLTDGEVAELLRVSRRTLQEYRNNRVLPFILLGGKVLYPETGLREVLEANYRKPLE